MKGMGRVFRRGQGWWITYCHQGREYRESARSAREEDVRAPPIGNGWKRSGREGGSMGTSRLRSWCLITCTSMRCGASGPWSGQRIEWCICNGSSGG
jgi:hypothetical protein